MRTCAAMIYSCRQSRKLTQLLFSSLLVLILIPQPSFSSPFTYSETDSGDLGDSFPAAAVFSFDVGTNTVSGVSFTFVNTSTGASEIDLDSFAFSIPAGAQLTQIIYSFSAGSIFAIVAQDQFLLDNGNALPSSPFLGDQTVDLFSGTPVTFFAAALPLGPGTYALQDFFHAILGTPGFPGSSWDSFYTWTFTVEAATVPEPASVLFLGAGAVALGFLRRRK